MHEKILLVDDEPDLLAGLRISLEREGYEVYLAESGKEAWQMLSEFMFDGIACDLAMEPMDGLTLLRKVRGVDSLTPFIMMTGAGSIETAVKAIHLGAYHYIAKPFTAQEFVLLMNRAVEHGRLHRKLEGLEAQAVVEGEEEMLIGNNVLIQQMLHTLDKVSASNASILIQGETGTGKSLFAKRIHRSSSRSEQPFYTIDCGALAETLLESELFGHVKGAFTGAVRAKRGLLEEARGGTIFLDEIGELTPATQMKLLRAVQEGEIKPVGGNTPTAIDVRFISATSRDLEQGVDDGAFRKDLYYRLAVIPLYLPPLRERRDDLLLFVDHFLRRFNARYRKNVTRISPCAMQMLLESAWDGNVRELENIMERAVLLTTGDTITLADVAMDTRACGQESAVPNEAILLSQLIEKTEIEAICRALEMTGGNRTRAARLLGISRKTLYLKMDAYAI